jgi:aldehyde dehydrogenase (NAD+)
MDHYKLFINNEFVDAASGDVFETIDPGNEVPLATVAKAGKADAEAAIAAARRSFDKGDWRRLTPTARLAKMLDFAEQINQQGLRLAATEAMDTGQIIALAGFTPMSGAGLMRNLGQYAATKFPWEEELVISGNAFSQGRDFIRREPIGVCVGIIPWNFPMLMAFWKIVPALVMGNSVVIKPATVTPLSALILGEAAKAAGIPEGVLNIIAGPGGELGKVLCTHKDVDKIAFTGSTEVGRQIMRLASDTVKKVTLELGGKSANIILDDADMDLAVAGAVFGTFFHQGQICESGTRVLVSAKIYDEFIEKIKKRTESLRVGYQMNPTSHLGPLVSREQLATVEGYVKIGKEEGAELITGGKRVSVEGIDGGFYYAPTIFGNVKNSMRIAQEEIFGPVVCVIKYDSDEEAAAIANDSIYGLGGGVFSSNIARAERVAREIRTGTVWINNYHAFGDLCPFGGYKQSGVGRELGAVGLAEYTQIKRIHVAYIANHRSNIMFQMLSDDKKMTNFICNTTTNVIVGHGSLSAIYKEIRKLGCSRAVIMTDPGVMKAGLAELAKSAMGDFCAGIYDKISADPDMETVDAAAAAARELKADCIVSVGGGSVMDTAKTVCVILKSGGKAIDHLNLSALSEPQIPHIAIPTTSGTGSEVTNGAVISSKIAGRKLFIGDQYIMPNAAILDPRFVMSMPKELTAATAMDAMAHAVEAVSSNAANPVSDAQALQAIRLIAENLPLAVADGGNEQARLNMQIAATLGGWALSVAVLGLAHGMAHTLGSLHHIPHGAACGLVLPQVMRFNVDHATAKLALVAQALGVNTAGMQERDAALAAADAVEALMAKVGHPLRLRDVGVPEEALPVCAFHAISDLMNIFNPRPVTDPMAILDLYMKCY